MRHVSVTAFFINTRGRPELSIFFLYANSIQGRTHPPTPMLSAILRLLSHFYGPLYACNNLKLVYLCTLEALEIKNLFDYEEKYRKKSIILKLSAIGVFANHPPTHPPVCY